jgi:hypothetical protein
LQAIKINAAQMYSTVAFIQEVDFHVRLLMKRSKLKYLNIMVNGDYFEQNLIFKPSLAGFL